LDERKEEMTDDYEDWILGAKYRTMDSRTVKCIALLDTGRAVIHDPETDGLWIVDKEGKAVLASKFCDIVDGPDATAEDIEGPVQEPHRLEMILESKLAWNDGYRTAIRNALEIVVGHVGDRQVAAMLTRRLLIGYEHPMADPPF